MSAMPLIGVTVRDAVPGDLAFMKRMLYEAANRPGAEWPPFEENMAELRNRRFWSDLMTRSTDVGVIAERAGSPVGACWVRQFPEGERGPMDEIGVPVLAVAVETDLRSQGVGDLMTSALIERVRTTGVGAIDLTTGSFNTAGVALYHRHNFVDVATIGDAIRMRLKLP